MIQGIQQNTNNLGVMSYLNNIPNSMMNLQGIGQIIPAAQNYPNLHGQINNMGINPINNNLSNNLNNTQFGNQFNPNLMNQMPQSQPSQAPILNKMESGNLNNNHGNAKAPLPKKNMLIDTLQGILQNINSGNSSKGDPRKNRKK